MTLSCNASGLIHAKRAKASTICTYSAGQASNTLFALAAGKYYPAVRTQMCSSMILAVRSEPSS